MADPATTQDQPSSDAPLSVRDASKLLLAANVPAEADQTTAPAAPAEPTAPAEATPPEVDNGGDSFDAISDLLGLSEGQPAEETQEPEPTRYRVKAGGEEVEVTLEELQRGYQRQTDYSQKTMELAEQRRAAEERQRSIAETEKQLADERERLQSRLSELNETLSQTVAQEPGQEYWDQLYAQDESEWARQKILWQETKERQAAVQAEAEKERANLAAAYERQLADRRQQEERRMLERIPSWKSSEVRTREMNSVVEHLRGRGFNDNEIMSEMDSRVVEMARDAWLLSQIKSQVAAGRAKATGPRPIGRTRANAQQTAANRETERLQKSLDKSGSIKDAVALLKARRQ